jgi:hypothetical protein
MNQPEQQGIVKTLSPERFLSQLALTNLPDEFKNTCKVLLNNYVHGKNVQSELTQALISVMLHNGHDILKLRKKFLDSIEFGNYELVFNPMRDEKGNPDGFEVEVAELDHKGEDTPNS